MAVAEIRPDWTVGNLTLVSGSKDFTTTGSALETAAIQAGDEIITQSGLVLIIASITGQNAGTLMEDCPAGAAGAEQPLRIRFQPDGSRYNGATADLIQMLGSGNLYSFAALAGSADKIPYFTGAGTLSLLDVSSLGGGGGGSWDAIVGTLSGRDQFNSEAAGFKVMVIDNGNQRSVVYEKTGSGASEWSAPIPFTGPIGADGANNVLSIGTVTAGSAPDVTITGASPSQVLNFVLEKGDKGDIGDVTPAALAAQEAAEAARDAAQGSAGAAANSATTATNKAAEATTARDFAYQWSSAGESVPVDDGVHQGFSAYHWSKVAENAAGGGIQYVNGKTGASITLTAADVGALATLTAGTNISITGTGTSRTISATAAPQVNSDWNATSGAAQILNKPTLGTAASQNSTAFATAAQGAKADSSVQTVNGIAPINGNVDVLADDVRIQDSRASAVLVNFPSLVNFVQVNGYSSVGDGGGGLYKRASSEPSHAGKFQSADGAWWELCENDVNPFMFGAYGDGVTDDHASLQAWLDFPSARHVVPVATFLSTSRLQSTNKHVHIEGSSIGGSVLLWNGSSGGLKFVSNAGMGSKSRASVTLSNLAIVTSSAGGGTGVSLEYTTVTTIPFGDATTLTLDNVEVRGDDFYESGGNNFYWNDCVHLTDTGGVNVTNLKLRGKAGVAGLNGFRITAVDQPNIRFFMTGLQFQGFQNAMLVESVPGKSIEGIYLTNYEFIACFRGFYATGGPVHAAEFGTGHIDATVSCIANDNSASGSSAWVVGAGAYLQLGNKWNGTYTAGNAIVLDGVDYSRVNSAYILGDPSKTVSHSGVLLRSSNYCSIDGNSFHHLSNGVGMEDAGVGQCVGSIVGINNTFSDVDNRASGYGVYSYYNRSSIDGGQSSVTIGGITTKSGTSVISLNSSGDGVIPYSVPFENNFISAVVSNGEASLFGDSSFVVKQDESSKSQLLISVRPSPGSSTVRCNWHSTGR